MEKQIIFFRDSYYEKLEQAGLIGLHVGKTADVLVYGYIPVGGPSKSLKDIKEDISDRKKFLKIFGIEINMPKILISAQAENVENVAAQIRQIKKKAFVEFDEVLRKEVEKIARRIVSLTRPHFGRHDNITSGEIAHFKKYFLGKTKLISCCCISDGERILLKDSGFEYEIWPCYTQGWGPTVFDTDRYTKMVKEAIEAEK